MGQPAARMGDLTAHGGTLAIGNPTVLIGGAPAATMGDMHVCPMCSPGPHVGGPISAGAPTVLIGGKPAARMGDMCVCAAPAPDVIAMGCPTVLIGGGGGGGSPGGAAAAASGANAAAIAAGLAPAATARPLAPWLGVAYTDAAGRPVTRWDYRASGGGTQREGQVGSGGQVWLDALAENGDVELGLVGAYACRWSRDEARVGDEVEMSAKCVGVESGTAAVFEVWRETARPDGSTARAKVWTTTGAVRGTDVQADASFAFAWPDDGAAPEAQSAGTSGGAESYSEEDDRPMRSRPDDGGASLEADSGLGSAFSYVCEVVVGGLHRARSGPLAFQDWLEVLIVDAAGDPVAGATFDLVLASGEVRQGTADASGASRFESVPAGAHILANVTRPQSR